MKFGGTSVADLDRIRAVATRVAGQVAGGDQVAVVVSAMAGVTNQLVGWCEQLAPLHDASEYDAVVATGEQVTAGLLAIALQERGVDARSWLGWQLPVLTNEAHGRARIHRIIYTDVDGVYTTDPRIVPRARRLPRIAYEEMLELASVGAKVLQTRSVELAMKERVRVRVLSSFAGVEGEGTLVVDEDEIMEKEIVAGIAYSRDEAKVTVRRVPDRPGIAASVFGPLAEASVNVDMIVQSTGADGTTDMTFTVGSADLAPTVAILERYREEIRYGELLTDAEVAKISVVGVGMRSHAGVASTMFRTLAEKSINIQVISTSEIKVSVLVGVEYTELAVRALHAAYGLDGR